MFKGLFFVMAGVPAMEKKTLTLIQLFFQGFSSEKTLIII